MCESITEAEISMVLDTYMYMNYTVEDNRTWRMTDVLEEMSFHEDYQEGGKYYGEYQILQQAAENPQIGDLVVKYPSARMGYDKGTAACTFVDEKNGKVFITYRGTGDGEWPDNGVGMTEPVTIQQRRALQYFEQVVSEEELGSGQRVIITGHSKGGNKAQFVTMETRYSDIIDRCYSVDGQGFSDAAIERWQKNYPASEYEERISKLYGINGENDFVSVLGYGIIPENHIRYIETPFETRNLVGSHDIKYMFASLSYVAATGSYVTVFHGRKNAEVAEAGVLQNYVAKMSEEVMALPREERAGAAMVLMQFIEALQGNRRGLNGEWVTGEQIKSFLTKGLPTIICSSVTSEQGKTLWKQVSSSQFLTEEIPRNLSFWTNYLQLEQEAEGLEQIGAKLEEKVEEITSFHARIPWYLQGKTVIHAQLLHARDQLEEASQKLKKMAMLQKSIAQIYAEAEKNSLEAGSG